MNNSTKGFTSKGFTKNFLGLMNALEKQKLCCLNFLEEVNSEFSISGNGTDNSPLTLLNDSSDPGADHYYGTDLNDTKGWLLSPVVFNGGSAFVGGDRSAFPGWPYNSTFTNTVLGVYGVMPYIDILVDINSVFGIGGIAWKSLDPTFPYITKTREGANTFAAIEANAFGTPATSTIEFYLGNLAGNDIMTPLTVGNLGAHFYGERLNVTIDAHYCLFVGNKIRANTPNFGFNNIPSTFAVDANNIPFTFFNYPNKPTVNSSDQVMILDVNGEQWMVTLSALKAALALAP